LSKQYIAKKRDYAISMLNVSATQELNRKLAGAAGGKRRAESSAGTIGKTADAATGQ
jgi:hypothetical protein